MKQQLPRLRFRSPTRVLFFFSLLLLVMLIGISGVTAQDESPTSTPVPHTGDSNPGLVTALAQGGAQIAYHEDTGAARFITAAPGRPIAQPVALQGNASREAAARGFLATYGPLFGIRDQSRELVRKTEKKPDANRTFERFQQVYNGVPVIGGELIVQVDSSNAVLSANGEVLPRIALSTTTPTITAAQAAQNALAAVAKYHNIAASDLAASTPVLSIYSPILISPDDGPTSLVWRMDVTRKSFVDIDEFVLIDAQRGSMTLHFSQIDNVLSRQVYSANHSQNLPGSLVCSEQDWNCDGDLDAQLAFDGAADTYN